MVDERLLRRLDWLLTALTVWLLLSLVLAGVVTVLLCLRSRDPPDVEVSVR